jgi:MFS family permease
MDHHPERRGLPPHTLQRSMTLVTVAGCLAMVYMIGVGNPMTTDFFRSLGMTEVHFGILGGLPMVMVGMQFVGAVWANRLRSRRAAFMVLIIVGRLCWIAIALVPDAMGDVDAGVRTAVVIGLAALSSALQQLAPPIWFSWMGDLIPRRILSRYWGGRMRWMWIVWLATHGALVLFGFHYEDLGFTTRGAFVLLVALGVAAGIGDIVLFLWVHEPPVAPPEHRAVLATLLEPLRQREYRSYLVWNCAFSAATMIGAAFMLLYVLKILEIPLWITMLIWWTPGLGSAVSSGFWGRVIDRYGSRPVLVLCSAAKPLSPLVFMLVTRPTAPYVLSAFFVLDSCLNAGAQLATNGFMLRMAPRQNRGMFTAAMTSLPSIAGGLAAILGGFLLRAWEGHEVEFAGRVWNNYQYLFLLSVVLRLACVPLALRIREPKSAHSLAVLSAIADVWPLRLWTLPVKLFRRFVARAEAAGRADADAAAVAPREAAPSPPRDPADPHG